MGRIGSEGSPTHWILLAAALLTLLGLVACVALSSLRADDAGGGPIYVVFRFDDYSQRGQKSVQEGVLEAFRRHDLPLTVAVIPCPADKFTSASDTSCGESLDASRVETLVSAHRDGTAEIALHGYSHVNAANTHLESEFLGVSRGEQQNRIDRGLDEVERLTGVRPVTFVPPFDSYNLDTLEALEALGMKAISGGALGPSLGEGLRYVPNTVYIKRVREAVVALRKEPDPGAVILSIFHPWDLEEADQMKTLTGKPERPVNLQSLDGDLAWLAEQPDVRVTTVEALSKRDVELGETRFAMARAFAQSTLWSVLPPGIGPPPRYYLYSAARYDHLELESWSRVLTYSLGIAVLISGIVLFGLRLARGLGNLGAMLAPMALGVGGLALLAGPVLMGSLGWKDFLVLLIAFGVCLGGALSVLEVRVANVGPKPNAGSV